MAASHIRRTTNWIWSRQTQHRASFAGKELDNILEACYTTINNWMRIGTLVSLPQWRGVKREVGWESRTMPLLYWLAASTKSLSNAWEDRSCAWCLSQKTCLRITHKKPFRFWKGASYTFNSVVCCTHFAVQHFLFTGKMETDVLALTRPELFE